MRPKVNFLVDFKRPKGCTGTFVVSAERLGDLHQVLFATLFRCLVLVRRELVLCISAADLSAYRRVIGRDCSKKVCRRHLSVAFFINHRRKILENFLRVAITPNPVFIIACERINWLHNRLEIGLDRGFAYCCCDRPTHP